MIKKILLLFLAISSVYFLLYLSTQNKLSDKKVQAAQVLSLHLTPLIQNRLAYLELTRLDASSAFNLSRSELISQLDQTRKVGLKNIQSQNGIPEIQSELTRDFPTLLQDSEAVYKMQETLIDQVVSTESYAEGIALLKSPEAIKLLTTQTNLILKYQYWLEKLQATQK